MTINKNLWITQSLFNLFIVALLGLGLRSKILFSIPGIDYRNLLSAHSHFAFAGWAGLSLMILFIYNILAPEYAQKKIYQWLLGGLQFSALGMAVSFPFYGYNALSIFFSSLYMLVVLIWAPVYIKDLRKSTKSASVKLLGISSIVSLILSFAGIGGLIYIMISKSTNSLLYRDSIYTFLHFQYNGFFTLAIFALLCHFVIRKNIASDGEVRKFALSLCLSVLPTLFLSLLWHDNMTYQIIAYGGSVLILMNLYYFIRFCSAKKHLTFFTSRIAQLFLLFSLVSFVLKMLLSVGTIFPQLGNAIYGDRPVIIGFLHLVFLGFLSFYLLAAFMEEGCFHYKGRMIRFPVVLFAIGIFANELLLMIQGLGILLQVNSEMYKWLLWIAAIILLLGALFIISTKLYINRQIKRT